MPMSMRQRGRKKFLPITDGKPEACQSCQDGEHAKCVVLGDEATRYLLGLPSVSCRCSDLAHQLRLTVTPDGKRIEVKKGDVDEAFDITQSKPGGKLTATLRDQGSSEPSSGAFCEPCATDSHGLCRNEKKCKCAKDGHPAKSMGMPMVQELMNLGGGVKPGAVGGMDDATLQQLKLAENRDTTEATLRWLALCPSFRVKQAVARHPNTPNDAMNYMADDPIPGVRGGVAQYTKDFMVLRRLLDDSNTNVVESAKMNDVVRDAVKADRLEAWKKDVDEGEGTMRNDVNWALPAEKLAKEPEGKVARKMKE